MLSFIESTGLNHSISLTIMDLYTKRDEYTSKGYQVANSYSDYLLFYTNKAIDKEVIVKWSYTNEIPRYISDSNFIFDKNSYEELKSRYPSSEGTYSSGGGGGGGGFGGFGGGGGGFGGGGSGGGGFRNLEYGELKVDKYIRKKFNEKKNIDKSFRHISNDLYVGTFIGFKDYNEIDKFNNKFNNINLTRIYFQEFPDLTITIANMVSVFFLIILIYISYKRFFHEDIPNEKYDRKATLTSKFVIIFLYSLIFIFNLVYISYKFSKIYNSERNNLTKIDADKFIKDFLKEVKDMKQLSLFISYIILLFFSICLFIIAWILSYIFTKRYFKLLEIANKINNVNNNNNANNNNNDNNGGVDKNKNTNNIDSNNNIKFTNN